MEREASVRGHPQIPFGIEVQSVEGEGSTFSLVIPKNTQPSEAE